MAKKEYDGDIFHKWNEQNDLHYVMENEDYLSNNIITYLGNKRRLCSLIKRGIVEVQVRLNKKRLISLDGFSGSGVVSRLLKAYSESLHVNDLELYAKVINDCYLSNSEDVDIDQIRATIDHLNNNKLRDDLGQGFIEELYAPDNSDDIQLGERAFYTNENARIIDNIRRMVEDDPNRHLFIAPLLAEASVRANTAGVFKGFYRNSLTKEGKFGGDAENCLDRIRGDISLSMPVFSRYSCPVYTYQEDINILVDKLPEMDLAYYDPPYNQHPYGSNYFMLNLICSYERPKDLSRVAGIPKDWNRSLYNTSKAEEFMSKLIESTRSKFILLSYNNEGIIPCEDLCVGILEKYGKVTILEEGYPAYRASRNLAGRESKVTEYLFILEK